MLLKTVTGNSTTGSSTNNLTLSDSSQDRTLGRQYIPALNPSKVYTQTKTQITHTYRLVSPENSIIHPVTNFEQTKQIIMDIDMFSHSPTLCDKILQDVNINGLCLYNSTHCAYLFDH